MRDEAKVGHEEADGAEAPRGLWGKEPLVMQPEGESNEERA